MNSLFPLEPIFFDVPDASISYYPNIFSTEESDLIFEQLKTEIPWQQDQIKVFGKTHLQPRLTALFGDKDKNYSYSNITMQPHPWNTLLNDLKSRVEALSDANFTTVLLNQYRNGQDSNGWHADNEKELGLNPIIASLSFGAARVFQMKHTSLKDQKLNILLEHGSLLLMKGTTQHFWKHQIAKTAKPIGTRINLTFRIVQYSFF
jgi:alkylated DNA repair dioxygenase AlkB